MRGCILITAVVMILFSILDEVHHALIPGRYGGLMDILLNLLGTSIAILFFTKIVKAKELRAISTEHGGQKNLNI